MLLVCASKLPGLTPIVPRNKHNFWEAAPVWAPSFTSGLATAEELYHVHNLPSTDRVCEHWVLMRAKRSTRRVEIFEPAKCVQKESGRKLLSALSAALGDHDILNWQVVHTQRCGRTRVRAIALGSKPTRVRPH